jgi:alkylhydroperoxidase family enzyme
MAARPLIENCHFQPYFSDAERAPLALTEAVTRLSDRPDAVPDQIWEEAARHYDERGLAVPILAIATTNVFNRINVTHAAGCRRRNTLGLAVTAAA